MIERTIDGRYVKDIRNVDQTLSPVHLAYLQAFWELLRKCRQREAQSLVWSLWQSHTGRLLQSKAVGSTGSAGTACGSGGWGERVEDGTCFNIAVICK